MAGDIVNRAKNIKLLILDVDGVLTDGRIIYDNSGNEFKVFDVRDGFGLALLSRAGIKCAIITAKSSEALRRRANDIGIARLYENASDKLEAYNKLLEEFGLDGGEVCFMGDDLIDLPILKRVGLAVAVKEAVKEVKDTCCHVTENSGGRGAVREVAEILLKAQGRWEDVMRKYHS